MSLLLSQSPERHKFKRNLKKTDHQPVPQRWMAVLDMHLSGMRTAVISEATGFSIGTVYKILSDERMVPLRQQKLKQLDQRFESLYRSVIQAIDDGLNSEVGDALKAAQLWLKAHGKLDSKSQSNQQNVTVSAEEVVFNILNHQPE